MTTAIAITGITLRTREVRGEKRVEVVVHCADDDERWIAVSEPVWSVESGNVDTMVTARGIKERPSQRCPIIGKAATKRFEDREIAAGNMKPRHLWGVNTVEDEQRLTPRGRVVKKSRKKKK